MSTRPIFPASGSFAKATGGGGSWKLVVAGVTAICILPIVSVVLLALRPAANAWPHLASTVLPDAALGTILLAVGVASVTLVVGTSVAWLVTMYRFPMRDLFDRLLVLPLAIPTYIAAFCYVELFDYAGPVQSLLRSLLGPHSPFPNIRSLPGAILVFASVLYPYVYLSARATFVQQSVCALEVARTLGRTPAGVFWSVALPMARPALAAGVALVVMETINDLGAVQYLGVETLTASIYATWLQRSNLSGAAQLATVMLLFVFALLVVERHLRGEARTHPTTGRLRSVPFRELTGWKAAAAAAVAALPVLTGLVVPTAVLLYYGASHASDILSAEFRHAMRNTVLLAALAATLTVTVAVVLAYARRVTLGRFVATALRLSSLGYAIPGTVLAIGLLYALGALDNVVHTSLLEAFGISTGLLFSGSIFALTLAYVIRFLAVALGGIEAGLERISPNLDAAARTLGETAFSALRRIHLPLLTPAIGAAALLVTVDVMKELPATLLLRPFNVETLATHVYNLAGIEQFERSAPAALMIILAGLIPLALLHRAIAVGASRAATSEPRAH